MINNINQISKELYEFDASNLGGGMFYDNFVVFNHGNNLYSVRNINTGVISLTKADCAMNAIEKINGDTEESTDERSVYSEFELWAYERYKLEWCVQHNVLPKDVDEEVGINGGECFISMEEFIDNEFEDYFNLSKDDRDNIYRQMWQKNVLEDVKSYADSENVELTDEQANDIAKLYVSGKYDCNEGYWTNIQTLINEVTERA